MQSPIKSTSRPFYCHFRQSRTWLPCLIPTYLGPLFPYAASAVPTHKIARGRAADELVQSWCHFDISCKQHLPDGLFLEELQCSPKLLGSDWSGFFCFSWSARSTKAFHHLQQRSAFIVKRVESLFLFSFERLHHF